MRRFYAEISAKDIHQYWNNIPLEELDKIYIDRSISNDLIAGIPRVLECIEGCKLVEHSNIVYSDHQGYIVNMNFEDYFKE